MVSIALALFLSAGCETTDNIDSTETDIDTNNESASEGSSDSETDSANDSNGDIELGEEAALLCNRWNEDRAEMDEGNWTGDVGTCNAGALSEEGRARALKILNLYRHIADLPAVMDDSARNAQAQECALLMHANTQLSHNPTSSWKCYSTEGAKGAESSSIAPLPAVAAVEVYMLDPGNPSNLGHRRWILSNSLGPVGIGSTDSYSCLWTLYGSGKAKTSWTAWPPPGYFPMQAYKIPYGSLSETGWTLQSDAIDLDKAKVTVNQGGTVKPVNVTVLDGGYGSTHAISFIPQGWQPDVRKTYEVQVTGIATSISYDVTFVDCSTFSR